MVDHCSKYEYVKRILVENRQGYKDLGEVCDGSIASMKITADGENLLVGDYRGHLKLISSRDGKVNKRFRRVYDGEISGIMITADQKIFFTSTGHGVLNNGIMKTKLWSDTTER
jgi:hypothetical protein